MDKTLTVRNLLIESKVETNVHAQIARLKEMSSELKRLSKNVKTISTLTENASTTFVNTNLKECSRLFKMAKSNLVDARDGSNIVEAHESLKTAYRCMNDIENMVHEIEESLHDVLDIIEEDQKYHISESVEYEEVYFAQEHEAEEVLNIIDQKGEHAALEYMKQWHYPGEHMTRPDPGYGSDDEVFEKDGYILSYNPRIGYAGLVHRVEER